MLFRLKTMKQEKKENLWRTNYLISKVATSPKQLLNEMPKRIPPQFQGEWAIYSCSMTCKALANIGQQQFKEQMAKIIHIAMSEEKRKYDAQRWGEDPFNGNRHLSYHSHLA